MSPLCCAPERLPPMSEAGGLYNDLYTVNNEYLSGYLGQTFLSTTQPKPEPNPTHLAETFDSWALIATTHLVAIIKKIYIFSIYAYIYTYKPQCYPFEGEVGCSSCTDRPHVYILKEDSRRFLHTGVAKY